MPSAKPLSKEMILAAMENTQSNKAAARYLNVSYMHYKKWAEFFVDKDTGETLWQKHSNQAGKGVPKFFKKYKDKVKLDDILNGRIDATNFEPQFLKYRLIEEGYLYEECSECGFHERRVSDYKIPLLLNFKDGNKKHWGLNNLELLCYNHYFLKVGDVFTEKQEQQIVDHKPVNEGKVDWEIDDYHLERLKELGLEDDDESDVDKYISRI
jgi:hypothetical protein|tara:strand:- start:2236 stop:2868 length:633 start_codon:yes stop_codon:yes gene_type:complete